MQLLWTESFKVVKSSYLVRLKWIRSVRVGCREVSVLIVYHYTQKKKKKRDSLSGVGPLLSKPRVVRCYLDREHAGPCLSDIKLGLQIVDSALEILSSFCPSISSLTCYHVKMRSLAQWALSSRPRLPVSVLPLHFLNCRSHIDRGVLLSLSSALIPNFPV